MATKGEDHQNLLRCSICLDTFQVPNIFRVYTHFVNLVSLLLFHLLSEVKVQKFQMSRLSENCDTGRPKEQY